MDHTQCPSSDLSTLSVRSHPLISALQCLTKSSTLCVCACRRYERLFEDEMFYFPEIDDLCDTEEQILMCDLNWRLHLPLPDESLPGFLDIVCDPTHKDEETGKRNSVAHDIEVHAYAMLDVSTHKLLHGQMEPLIIAAAAALAALWANRQDFVRRLLLTSTPFPPAPLKLSLSIHTQPLIPTPHALYPTTRHFTCPRTLLARLLAR